MPEAQITTKIEVKQCARCEEITFECYSGGLHISAEPSALSLEQYRQCVISDVRTFCLVQNAAGKPTYLISMLLTDKFQPSHVLAQHKCGSVKHWSKKLEVADVDPKDFKDPEEIRQWCLKNPHVVGGTLSSLQNGSSPLATTPVPSTAHVTDESGSSLHFDAARLIRDGLGAHPIFKEFENRG